MNTRTENRPPKEAGGFTLVEVVVAMAIAVTGILSVAGMQVKAVSTNAIARRSLHATALAARCMEALIALNYDSPALEDRTGDGAAGLDRDTVEAADGNDRGHPPYTICWNVASIPEAPGSGTVRYKRLRVVVIWKHRGMRRRLALETILTDT